MAGYGDDTKFAAWLAALGYTLPVGAPTPAVLRQRGADYIDAVYGARFIGFPTGGYAQERQWPRANANTCWGMIPDYMVPVAVENASYYAAYQDAVSPGSLSIVTTAEGAIKREKVGQLEVEYAGPSESGSVTTLSPLLSSVDGLLAPYLRPDPNTFTPIFLQAIGE